MCNVMLAVDFKKTIGQRTGGGGDTPHGLGGIQGLDCEGKSGAAAGNI